MSKKIERDTWSKHFGWSGKAHQDCFELPYDPILLSIGWPRRHGASCIIIRCQAFLPLPARRYFFFFTIPRDSLHLNNHIDTECY